MNRPLLVVVVLALLPPGLAMSSLDLSVGMRYSHQVGQTTTGHVTAKIEGLEMGGGLPVAATGSVDVDVTLEVLAVDADGVATVRMSFGEMRSEFMGESRTVNDQAPVEFALDPLGRTAAGDMAGDGQFDLLGSGGIPVQLLGTLAAIVQLPEQSVPYGQEWSVESEAAVPELGTVTLSTRSRLVSLSETEAVVSSTITGKLPDFTTKSPMGPGDIAITQADLAVEDLQRSIDLASGFVRTASGRLTVTCLANLGGMGDMPLKVLTSFELKPVAAAGGQARAVAPPVSVPVRTAPTAQPLMQTAAQLVGVVFEKLAALWRARAW